ncbi:MAG: YdcF family protein [Nitrospirae bacterium]|nr:MAG: YdcF family protein [Nitrospirota bacterium]
MSGAILLSSSSTTSRSALALCSSSLNASYIFTARLMWYDKKNIFYWSTRKVLYLLKVIKEILLPPSSLLLVITVAFIMVLKGRKKTGTALAITGIFLFYLLSTELGVTILIGPLEKKYPPLKSLHFQRPYVVVLTGGANDLSHIGIEVEPSGSSTKRLLKGIEIFQSSEDAILLIAGGRGSADSPETPEALVLERLAKALGVPEKRIIIEITSRDTWENAKNLATLLKNARGPVVLVTSAFHMQRAVWCFKKLGIRVIPAPTDYRSSPITLYSLVPSAQALRDSSTAISEYLAYGWYLLTK